MRRWERRLKDLALALDAAGKNYFEPELFRLNSNNFLTTSRTVSFLFKKDKTEIPEFESWHAQNIVSPWKSDKIMKWSIASRNTIEKEGDLDMYSTASATLIFSYLEENDISLNLEKSICLGASIKKLTRFARSKLPSGISDVAVIKIERTWIANTLPDCELIQAFRYIYARMFEACKSLALHLGTTLEPSIPDPTSFDDTFTRSRGVYYFKLNSTRIGTATTHRYSFDKSHKPPESLSKLQTEITSNPPRSLDALVKFYGKIAEATFLQFGNHVAMLWLFNEKFEVIDYISTTPADHAEKFIFWRAVSDRIHYLKAKYLVWTAEAWIRSGQDMEMTKITRNLPIIGEILHVVGIDDEENSVAITWNIERKNQDSKPTLKIMTTYDEETKITPYYLVPAKRALRKVRESTG